MERIEKMLKVDVTCSPNALQAGMWLAQGKDYYRKEGIEVKLSYPTVDDLTIHDEVVKACEKLIKKETDVCILPTTSIIYVNTRQHLFPEEVAPLAKLVGIATLTQKDFVGIGTLRKRDGRFNIERPKDLDNKTYGSSGLKFSEELVKEMIKADGGKGDTVRFELPTVNNIYRGLKEGRYDACCVCVPIHETMAKRDNNEMKVFCPKDFRVPHPYSAVICVREETIKEKKEQLKKFLRCTRRGYEELYKTDSEEVARILRDQVDHPNMKDSDFVRDTLERAKDFILGSVGGTGKGEAMHWGVMDVDQVKGFVDFLKEKKILKDDEGKPITKELDVASWFRNELLQ